MEKLARGRTRFAARFGFGRTKKWRSVLPWMVFGLLSGATAVACGDGERQQALAGSWIATSGADFLIVRQTEGAWIVEDGDGRYPAEYTEGILRISIGIVEDLAAVYDSEAGTMVMRMGTQEKEFKRAQCSGFTGGYIGKAAIGLDLRASAWHFRDDCTWQLEDQPSGRATGRGVYDVREGRVVVHTDRNRVMVSQIVGDEIVFPEQSGGYVHVMVREGTDAYAEVLERHTALMAPMKSDLRNLIPLQERYLADHGSYATTLDQLQYSASSGVTMLMDARERTSWNAHANASNGDFFRTCWIWVGRDASLEGGPTEGEPSCESGLSF